MPPVNVHRPAPVEVSVLFVAERAKALLMVNGAAPCWLRLMTLDPSAPLMVAVPLALVPALMMEPVLLIEVLASVMAPLAALPFNVIFPVPVMDEPVKFIRVAEAFVMLRLLLSAMVPL